MILVGLLGAGCLGQDYKNIELVLTDADRGWLALVEPGEDFSVTLYDSPLHAGATWSLAQYDAGVVSARGSFYETEPRGDPADMPPEEAATVPSEQLGIRVFEFTGLVLGTSSLDFELIEEDETVDIAEFTIGVVEEACEGDRGLAAPRCRRAIGANAPESMNWGHGESIALSVGEYADVRLAGNALHPEASWRLVEHDPDVSTPTQTVLLPARTPGNWNTLDPDEPASFLEVSQFWFWGVSPGVTVARFELAAGDEVIEICEFKLVVEA